VTTDRLIVRKILSKEYGWKIELVAFERSISKQMRDITRKLSYRKDDRAMRALCMGWVP